MMDTTCVSDEYFLAHATIQPDSLDTDGCIYVNMDNCFECLRQSGEYLHEGQPPDRDGMELLGSEHPGELEERLHRRQRAGAPVPLAGRHGASAAGDPAVAHRRLRARVLGRPQRDHPDVRVNRSTSSPTASGARTTGRVPTVRRSTTGPRADSGSCSTNTTTSTPTRAPGRCPTARSSSTRCPSARTPASRRSATARACWTTPASWAWPTP